MFKCASSFAFLPSHVTVTSRLSLDIQNESNATNSPPVPWCSGSTSGEREVHDGLPRVAVYMRRLYCSSRSGLSCIQKICVRPTVEPMNNLSFATRKALALAIPEVVESRVCLLRLAAYHAFDGFDALSGFHVRLMGKPSVQSEARVHAEYFRLSRR